MRPKLVDVGEIPSGPSKEAVVQQKWYQSVTVDADDFPILADKEVGDELAIIAIIRKIGESEDEQDGKAIRRLRLQIRKVGEVAKEERDILKDMGYRARG